MQLGSIVEKSLARWRRWRCESIPGALGNWHRERGQDRLSANLPVRSTDLVVDGGGYEGDWAALMAWRYGCRVLTIEPIPDFYLAIQKRFASNDRITVVNAALGAADGTVQMTVAASGSSAYGPGERTVAVRTCDTAALLQTYCPGEIGCLKLNIEGGEYDVLRRLIDTGLLPKIRSLLIQFHRVVPNCEGEREAIQAHLAKTHNLVFDYPFIWERWELTR